MIRTRILKHNYWFSLIAALFLVLSSTVVDVHATERSKKADSNFTQTDVDRAKHSTDASGIPILNIEGVGEVYHPAWTGLYALNYAGIETYDARLQLSKSHEKFEATISWLEDNLEQNKYGLWVWLYKFDSTYNDVSILAPWSSAFAQAVGIQALLAAYRIDGNKRALDLAKKAAISLITPIEKGGLLFRSGADIWFEEIPVPAENPSHILNGHMRALLALKELVEITNDQDIKRYLNAGVDTLYKWLPLYDTSYSLRYDLNPRKKELLFRFANPYGFQNIPLAINKIALVDPETKKEVDINVGMEGDADGDNRISGTDWGSAEKLQDRMVRRLKPSQLDNEINQVGAPHTYFYLSLPASVENNLREQWYELVIEYYDQQPGNITVQQRSISPGPAFRDMRDGDLHLTGSKQWRKWRVPLRPTDLGYWIGSSYAEKHALYLDAISEWDARFKSWTIVARGYLRMGTGQTDMKFVDPVELKLPKQTPMLPIYSLDRNGVLMQSMADDNTLLDTNGMYNPAGGKGYPVYSPYVIASQLLQGNKTPGAAYSEIDSNDIKRKPALKWLMDERNYRAVNGAAIYTYPFDNAYNDIYTKQPWPSAFGQAYILEALVYASKNKLASNLSPSIEAAANAYRVLVADGGITTKNKSGFSFYEEVPNATHVLNAHLVSIPELSNAAEFLKNKKIEELSLEGIKTLRKKLYLYDTGYWLRYDLNPKKNFLIQFDWLQGDSSPLIDEIVLENPQMNEAVRIDIGTEGDFKGEVRLAGTEWGQVTDIDGKNVRGFINGYLRHAKPLEGGTRHNAYLSLSLPSASFDDFFDVPAHILKIKYKDVSVGQFGISIQAINSGNHLTFSPLRGGVWKTVGDQQWKEHSFYLRPQDMGWYKGADYQAYEVEQLRHIATQTHDWYFDQYAKRHQYFLDAAKENKLTIINDIKNNEQIALKLIDSSPTYDDHGFENAIDGSDSDNYVAGKEGADSAFATFSLLKPIKSGTLSFVWESDTEFPELVEVYGAKGLTDKYSLLAREEITAGGKIDLGISADKAVGVIRIVFSRFHGQKRILLRSIKIYNKEVMW